MIDFKIKKITEARNRQKGVIVLYEGTKSAKEETNPDTGEVSVVDRYRRETKLEEIMFDIHNDDINGAGIHQALKKLVSKRVGELNKEIIPKQYA